MWITILIASTVNRKHMLVAWLLTAAILPIFSTFWFHSAHGENNWDDWTWVAYYLIGALECSFWFGLIGGSRWLFIWRKKDAAERKARKEREVIVARNELKPS
jgi:hypothetical protein